MDGMTRDDAVRAAAEAAHDAYERRAAEVGWETQARSRVAWADVPEANKQAMYAAMDAAAPHLTADLVRERDEARGQVEHWKRMAKRREEALDALGAERNTWARQMADLRDEREDAHRAKADAEARMRDALNERDEALAEVERLDRDARAVAGRCLHYEARAEAAEAEIERLRVEVRNAAAIRAEQYARIARVEALVPLWRSNGAVGRDYSNWLRDALRGDQT